MPLLIVQRTIPRPSLISYVGRVEAQQHERAVQQHHRALGVGVLDADQPERHAREVLPVRAREPLEVRRRPDLHQLALGHRDVGGLDRAHRPRGVHRRVLLGIGDHRVGDVLLARAVEELQSAALTASSKPSGRSLMPVRRALLHDHLGLQPVHQRAHEPGLDRRDERDPVGGEARREHGHRDDARRGGGRARRPRGPSSRGRSGRRRRRAGPPPGASLELGHVGQRLDDVARPPRAASACRPSAG